MRSWDIIFILTEIISYSIVVVIFVSESYPDGVGC